MYTNSIYHRSLPVGFKQNPITVSKFMIQHYHRFYINAVVTTASQPLRKFKSRHQIDHKVISDFSDQISGPY
jgi:hypothetical protein